MVNRFTKLAKAIPLKISVPWRCRAHSWKIGVRHPRWRPIGQWFAILVEVFPRILSVSRHQKRIQKHISSANRWLYLKIQQHNLADVALICVRSSKILGRLYPSVYLCMKYRDPSRYWPHSVRTLFIQSTVHVLNPGRGAENAGKSTLYEGLIHTAHGYDVSKSPESTLQSAGQIQMGFLQ